MTIYRKVSLMMFCFLILNAQENRIFWDGREWNNIRKNVCFSDKNMIFGGLGECWVPGWNQGSKKGEKDKFTQPLLGGNSVTFVVLCGV